MVDKVYSVYETLLRVKETVLSDVRTKACHVVVMGPVNRQEEMARSGWIGVYIDNVDFTPRTVGAGNGNWNSDTTIRVIVQRVDYNDPQTAFEKLSELVKAVIDVLMSNTALGGLSEMMPSVRVTYATRDTDATTLYFQGALITVNFISRSQVTP